MNHLLSSMPQSRQKGFILLMTLVLLILITIFALNQASSNTSQTRIAANATDSESSFEKAEGVMNEAINYLLNGTYSAAQFLQNGSGLYLYDATIAPLWTTVNWSSGNAITSNFQGNSSSNASYIIEQLPSVVQPGQNISKPSRIYRITVNSVGASGNTTSQLQSTIQIQQ